MDFLAESFYLNLGTVIFRLIGIDLEKSENETIYLDYLERCSQSIHVDMKENQNTFDELAMERYRFLPTAFPKTSNWGLP